jgi:hypothetical protein
MLMYTSTLHKMCILILVVHVLVYACTWVKVVFWTNTENFLLLNVGHTMSPVRVIKRTEAARRIGCIYRD